MKLFRNIDIMQRFGARSTHTTARVTALWPRQDRHLVAALLHNLQYLQSSLQN
jgi:hypothetical protein